VDRRAHDLAALLSVPRDREREMNVRRVLPRDAIPSVDDPEFGTDYVGGDDEEVLVLEGDPPRAYPTRYLNYHEIVNDRVPGLDGPAGGVAREGERKEQGGREGGSGDLPVAVTWCPLCGSAVAYDRRVDGRVLEFGVSGKLADDDLVMYDRETGSEWKQSTGTAIDGPLEGRRLAVLPAAVTTVGAFRRDHPEGLILAPPGRADEGTDPAAAYDDEPYREYFSGEGFGLDAHRGEGPGREWDREDLRPKDVVLGIERGGEAVGFPADRVAERGAVGATVGGGRVVVVTTPEGTFAYEHPGGDVEPTDGGFRADGTAWDGTTGRGDDGRRLERVPARRSFAFAWQDDHGPDAFYGPQSGSRST
jgi:hypothetical protein